MKPLRLLLFILVLFLLSLFVALPRDLKLIGRTIRVPGITIEVGSFSFIRDLQTKLGLDIAGGSHLVFETDMSNVKSEDKESALTAAASTVERRVNLFGVSEPLVQTSKVGESYRVIAELPGVTDTTSAINLLGQTAQLVFAQFEEEKTNEATPSAQLVPTSLTGKELVRAQIQFDP
ncbi:MAG: hypothetical protein AAB694_01000, partial [Patescibacteria group bacterium]